jgi:hypothetical protein
MVSRDVGVDIRSVPRVWRQTSKPEHVIRASYLRESTAQMARTTTSDTGQRQLSEGPRSRRGRPLSGRSELLLSTSGHQGS